MKKIGIVGGLGPESTLIYYQQLINGFKASYVQTGYPEIGIESLDLKAIMALIENHAWDSVVEIISQRFEVLRKGGAQIGAIASNTPHKVFEQIQNLTALPLVSIVKAASDHAAAANFQKLCLMGTQVTMSGDFYQQVFDAHGIELIVPNADEQVFIQEKLFSEIEFGIIKTETRNGFLSILERIQDTHGVEGVILGCTELPLILNADAISFPCLDTTAIHVTKIVELTQI